MDERKVYLDQILLLQIPSIGASSPFARPYFIYLLFYFSYFGGGERLDSGRFIYRKVLRHLSSTSEPTMANFVSRIPPHWVHLGRGSRYYAAYLRSQRTPTD